MVCALLNAKYHILVDLLHLGETIMPNIHMVIAKTFCLFIGGDQG